MKNKKILVCFILFIGCSNINSKQEYWKKIEKEKIELNLQAGDILIKEKEKNFLGMFGHSAIMKSDIEVLDYPKLGKKSYEVNINYWLQKDRKFLIMRYKNMDKRFKEQLLKNIEIYSKKPYRLSVKKTNDNGFYCSQFIWFVYFKTAQELGISLNLDANGGFVVFPYDFISSKELYIVN